jgi:hypothetical protein
MTDSIAVTGMQQKVPARATLACRLRPKEVIGKRGPIKNQGELELENLSASVIEISYQMSPVQYLDLTVTGPSGEVVSEGHFGDHLSPMSKEEVLRLQPGEKFISIVPLLATLPDEQRAPGRYLVHAVYEYRDLRAATADPVEVVL